MSWNADIARLVKVAGLSVLLVLGLACGSSPAPSGPTVLLMRASWAEHYTDLASLKSDSDVAIVGMVSGVAAQTVRDGIPFTDFRVRVVRVLHDPRSRLASSSTIVVHQTGGSLDHTRVMEVRDDRLFRIGETMALFLREFAPGHFRVLGGPAGRFEVARGAVTSTDSGTIRMAGRHTVDQFADEVARA